MTAKKLGQDDVGKPDFLGRFDAGTKSLDDAQLFDLSSHTLAREALDFALSMEGEGYNIFVLGEDRSGRMDATRGYVTAHVSDKAPSDDWVYLNNFRRTHKPRPVRLPAGKGRAFRDDMAELLPALTDALRKAFTSDAYGDRIRTAQEATKAKMDAAYGHLRGLARSNGLDIWSGPQGLSLVMMGDDGKPVSQEELLSLPEDRRAALEKAVETLNPAMIKMRATAQREELYLTRRVREVNREIADETTATLLAELEAAYGRHQGLTRWLVELRSDILDNLHLFQGEAPADHADQQSQGQGGTKPATQGPSELTRRYAVNLIVDNGDTKHPNIVLEPNPTYENLFGAIEYLPVSGSLHTDFTMIRSGALHQANGGILILRADAISGQQVAWHFLKGALRDREIRIEELHRYGGVPLTGTPKPKAIPLDVKIVLVGTPTWYYRLLSADQDFRTYFKVKAEIDPHVPTSDEDVALFAHLIQRQAANQGHIAQEGAINLLLGHAARWADNRDKLSSRFELIADLLAEAAELSSSDTISADCIAQAISERRRRNSRAEERSLERITDGSVLIDTDGAKAGQVNGLVYLQLGDHAFGLPSRITARTYVGAYGIVNIERRVAMGGPIQQKGALIVEGYLNGLFARTFPLSFSCSITFEQSYGGVEGDSASLAETCAIVSSLSGVPMRQDIAMTGSLNQTGEVQAIGGANHKIEGFFRTCKERGLTGKQGAVVPISNENNLVLKDEVVEAIEAGQFHIWSAATASDAIELLTGMPAGEPDGQGAYPAGSVFGHVMTQLEAFDLALSERGIDRRQAKLP